MTLCSANDGCSNILLLLVLLLAQLILVSCLYVLRVPRQPAVINFMPWCVSKTFVLDQGMEQTEAETIPGHVNVIVPELASVAPYVPRYALKCC